MPYSTADDSPVMEWQGTLASVGVLYQVVSALVKCEENRVGCHQASLWQPGWNREPNVGCQQASLWQPGWNLVDVGGAQCSSRSAGLRPWFA